MLECVCYLFLSETINSSKRDDAIKVRHVSKRRKRKWRATKRDVTVTGSWCSSVCPLFVTTFCYPCISVCLPIPCTSLIAASA